MKRKNKIKIFSFLTIPLTLSTLFIPSIIKEINQHQSFLSNNQTKIREPKRLSISETYKTNKFNFSKTPNGDAWEWDENNKIWKKENKNLKQVDEFNLLSYQENQNSNLLFPFAKKYDQTTDSLNENIIMDNTIEIDLNTWKPIGMEDKIFLKSLQFDVDGYVAFDTKVDDKGNQLNKSQRIMNYNIDFKNSYDDSIRPKDDTHYNNFLLDNPFIKEKRLVFNLLNGDTDKLKYGSIKNGYCFLIFEIEHQKSQKQTLPTSFNRLLITPKIAYAWPENSKSIINYPTTIPSQNITFTFLSSLFQYDSQNQISIDSYISDNIKLELSEKREKEETNLLLDTSKNIKEVILTSKAKDPNEPDLGQSNIFLIPEINIDTSNFYLDDSNNHKNTNFKVSIEGIKLSNALIKVIETNSLNISITKQINILNDFYEKDHHNSDIKIEFEINENELPNVNSSIEKSISIFDNSKLSQNDKNSFGKEPLGLDLILTIEPKTELIDGIKSKIPFQYVITKMVFKGINGIFNDLNSGIFYQTNVSTLIESSNEVIVKTTPLDFSFTRMNQALIKNVMRNEYQLESQYSSNIFDDSFFTNIDQWGNQTNYQKIYQEIENRFINAINQSKDWQVALGINSTNNLNLNNYFNSPFIKTIYTGKVEELRTKGQMSLKYSSIYDNKYFKYLDLFINVALNHNNDSSRKEIIELSIDDSQNNKLDYYLDLFYQDQKYLEKNIDAFVQYLNKELNMSQKYEIFTLINLDTFDSFSFIIQSINFIRGSQTAVKAQVILQSKYQMINPTNELLTNEIEIQSHNLKIKTFSEKVVLSLNEDLIRTKAKEASNYNDFKNQNSSLETKLKLINLSFKDNLNASELVDQIEFIDVPNFNNKVTVKVILKDGYNFNNNSNSQTISIANVNWKNQSNISKPIAISLNYQTLANEIRQNYLSAEDFIDWSKKATLENLEQFFIFNKPTSDDDTEYEQSNINQIHSIKFEKLSTNKLKVIVEAKEWYYFQYPGSTQANATREFIISNLTWKNQKENQVEKTNVLIQEILMIQKMISYYNQWKQNNDESNKINFLRDFVNQNISSFIKEGNNSNSIIRIEPLENAYYCINNYQVIGSKNGIYILVELNEGYYLNQNNNYDCYIATFEKFISISEIQRIYEEYNDPQNPIYVDLTESNFNLTKLTNDAQEYENINDFIANKLNSEYQILQYINFDNQHQDNYDKIETLSVKKINNNELMISIKLFNGYYYQNFLDNQRDFVFQLIFKNNSLKLIPVTIDLNRDHFALKAKEYENRDAMVFAFQDKTTYQDYQNLISINQNRIEAIEKITMKSGLSLNSIIIEIKIKSGYYFLGYHESQLTLSINISNLLFKNDPSYEETFTKISFKFKGNEFLQQASQFDNINQLIKFLYQDNNWKQFLEITSNKEINDYPILSFNVYQKNTHKLLIKLQLKEGYYFENQHYTNLIEEIVVGNIYYKNQEKPVLKNIDVKFNTKKFYNLTKELKDKSWEGLINLISPEIINFKDTYNGILWVNTKKQEIFKIINIKIENNQLVIILELDNGYYFDDQDLSNSRIELTYDAQELTNKYYSGIKKINEEINKRNWIIALSITLPFAGLIIAVIVYIVKTKRKSKKEEMGEI